MSEKTLRVTYTKSAKGYPRDQHQTIRSLGFTRLNQTIEVPNTPDVRGMLYKVGHLIWIEDENEITGSTIHEQT